MKKKLVKISKNINFIFLLCTILIAGIYVGILHNQTLPLAEGWYTYYAQCINEQGLMPYKDFEYLYSPIYLFLITFVTRVFGYNIIVLRLMGILMFCTIALGIYLLIQFIVGKEKGWIACIATVTSIFYMQSEVVQVFYDYVRLMDIVTVFTTLFLLKAVKKITKRENCKRELFLTGLLCALLLNIKQNVGMIYAAYVVVLIIYLGIFYRENGKNILKSIGIFLLPHVLIMGILYFLLASTGSLSEYLQSTGSGAISAKGGIFAILFNWIPNNWDAFKSGFPFAICILFIMGMGIILNIFLNKKNEKYEYNEKLDKSLGIAFVFIMIIFLFLIKESEDFTLSIFSNQYLTPYIIFMVGFPIFVLFGIWGLKDIMAKENSMEKYLLLFTLSGVYFAIAYSCGNSGGISEGQSTLGVALIITIFLMLFSQKWEYPIRCFIVFICVGLTLQCAEKKMLYTYNWWGMDDSNFWSSNQETNIPLLKGIYMSLDSKNTYENIYQIIMDNTTENDTIYCFPQIPIFYSICNRSDPGVRSKVQWFDVSTDEAVIHDIDVIEHNTPKVIVMYNVSEYAYQSHEKAFRKGQMSGTRVMRDFLYDFVYENQYTFAGRFTYMANSIQVWVRDDTTTSKIRVFSGGDGTYENPYLLETAEQLVLFSKMVNEGRTFENCYIKQIADIDLSSVPNWESIGKFGSNEAFYGVYDGAGHIIKNLHAIKTTQDYNNGLFGQLGGKVYNLGLEGGNINGLCSGGIASHSIGDNAAIVNCYSNIDIVAERAGGIADNFHGMIKNCISMGKLQGKSSADIISYCADGMCDMDKIYIVWNSFSSPLYNATLHDSRITYCDENFINSTSFVDILNCFVNEANISTVEEIQEIKLTNWKLGIDGHPVFATQ